MTGQLADQMALFDPMEEKRAAAAAALADWQAQFERRDMVAGNGETYHGWVCPNCGCVEPNGFVLQLNHGWCPEIPGDKPYDPAFCLSMDLVSRQQWWRRGRENPCTECGAEASRACDPTCPAVLVIIRREDQGDAVPEATVAEFEASPLSASCEACGADTGQDCGPDCINRTGKAGDS